MSIVDAYQDIFSQADSIINEFGIENKYLDLKQVPSLYNLTLTLTRGARPPPPARRRPRGRREALPRATRRAWRATALGGWQCAAPAGQRRPCPPNRHN